MVNNMEKDFAKKLVKDVLQHPFEKRRYAYIVRELLNHIEETPETTYRGNYIPDAYKEYITTLDRIGKYVDPDGKKIDILIVHLKKETSLERARTMQRNFVAWFLKRRGEKDAALAAFISPDQEDWRFSFVKMEYKFVETPKGHKAQQEFTPARRYSFLVGENENSHTAQSCLAPILIRDEPNPTLKEIEDAFSIEKVTKEFFLEYRKLFLRTKEELDRVIENDPKIKVDFEAKGVDTVNFAKKLLGQIIFLYFLQKKGWFGVGRDNDWGTGSKHFLRELFEKKHSDYNNFFNDILEPLFYEALRIDRSHDDDYYSRFDCKIPFLNGGLFDPIGNYDWVHTDIIISDRLFSNDVKTKEGDTGDGILDIFDRYNFTVKEDEPLEKEVAIDPELLGKAYEKFNAIRPDNFEEYKKALKSGKKGDESKFNKQFGVYYTPREIVHYMCQQSLINYLYSELNKGPVSYEKFGDPQLNMLGNKGKKGQLDLTIEHKQFPCISKENIETLIHIGEHVSENEARVLRKGKETKDYSYQLPESIRKNAALIDQKLEDITVCDPAVGSGAFPVGMMSEIVRARNVLSTFFQGNSRTPYDFKRRCIEHSIYGVDIDTGAVEIAKLRLWLSLVVDEDDIKLIKPLPNLDYKVVCGNSLLGYPYTPTGLEGIEQLKEQFFREVNPTQKNEFRRQIDDAIYGLFKNTEKSIGYKVTMDFKINFSEVFHNKGGFDVVIANPPYVRADSGPEYLAFRKKLEESKTYQTLYEKWDLMVPFIERGLCIANTKGALIYIVSNAICTSKYAFKLLDLFQKEYFTRSIDYFEDMAVFEAGVIPVVIQVAKTNADGKTKKYIHRDSFENIVCKTELSTEEFKGLERDAFRKEYNPFVLKTLTICLGDICYMSKGMVINADEKKAQGAFTKDDLISEKKTKIHSRPYIEGKDIDLYILKRSHYLEWGTKRVPGQLSRATFPELYDRPKIMRGRVTGGIYDNSDLLCNDSIVVFVRFIDLNDVNNKSIQTTIKKFNIILRPQLEKISEKFVLKYLLAVLNSSFAFKYLNNIRRHRLKNYFYPDDFRKLPIADISAKEQKPFVDLVEKILAITKDKNYLNNSAKQAKVKKLEKQIDQMVYKLYGLTKEEIAIVEEHNKTN